MKNNRSAIQKRQMQLLHYLKENGSGDVSQISEFLGVSPITVRRDLDELANRSLVVRYFGGARYLQLDESDDEPAYLETTTQRLEQKRAIVQRAAELLEDGDIVFINSSSTALLIYPYIQAKSIMIVTNNGRSLLAQRASGVELILTGGEVYGNKQSLVGQFALDALARITATKCILGVSGISVQGGITSRIIQETAINQMMLNRCSGSKIVVADSSKIGVEHNFFSGKIEDIDRLITDTGVDTDILESIRNAGIIVDTVNPINDI